MAIRDKGSEYLYTLVVHTTTRRGPKKLCRWRKRDECWKAISWSTVRAYMQNSSKRGHGRNDRGMPEWSRGTNKASQFLQAVRQTCSSNRVDGLEWIRKRNPGPQEEGRWDGQNLSLAPSGGMRDADWCDWLSRTPYGVCEW